MHHRVRTIALKLLRGHGDQLQTERAGSGIQLLGGIGPSRYASADCSQRRKPEPLSCKDLRPRRHRSPKRSMLFDEFSLPGGQTLTTLTGLIVARLSHG
jgi:hypothetical protein